MRKAIWETAVVLCSRNTEGSRGFSAPMAMIAAVLACLPWNTAASAEVLTKRQDAEGNVHYGTERAPDLCCMCRPALRYEAAIGRTVFHLPHGIERAVGNDRVFLSDDGRAWYCEGTRELGRLGRKCGLVPPVM